MKQQDEGIAVALALGGKALKIAQAIPQDRLSQADGLRLTRL